MREVRHVMASLVALVALVALGGHAQAQEVTPTTTPADPPSDAAPTPDPPERVEARQRYQQGVVFFRAERFREAIAEFTAAYVAWDNPLILYSLGQSYERLLEVPRAIDAYSRFLAAVPEDDPRRAEVTAKIDTLRLLLATLRVTSNVPATVWVNGEALGTAPGDIALAVGRWDVEVRADGYATHRESVSLAARSVETLDVTLVVASSTTVVEHGNEVPVAVFATFATATVLATGVAIGLGIHTMSLSDAYRADPTRTVADQAEGRSWATATDVVGIGAGALAIAAFVLAFLTDWDGDSPASTPPVTTSLLATPNGAMMTVGGAF